MNDEKTSRKSISERIKRFYYEIKPLLLSHHPDCNEFRDHVFELKGKKFCIGCFIGYPSMLLTILVLFLIQIYNFIHHRILLIIGLVLFCTYALKIFKFMRDIKGKIFIRILIGAGLGFLFWGIFGSPLTPLDKILSSIVMFGGLYLVYSTVRVISVFYTCHKCSYDGDWKHCPGFKNNPKYHEIELNEKKEKIV